MLKFAGLFAAMARIIAGGFLINLRPEPSDPPIGFVRGTTRAKALPRDCCGPIALSGS